MGFGLRTLFGPLKRDPKLAAYPTWQKELASLASGRKGMSREVPPASWAAADPEFRAYLAEVSKRGLVVVLQWPAEQPRRAEHHSVRMFTARPDQLWRIPAHVAYEETAFAEGYSWSAENLESYLLGYSATQRRRWIARRRAARPTFGCMMVHALLDAEQKRRVVTLGGRTFGTAREVEGIELFWVRGVNDTVRPTAHRRIPKGFTLARIGISGNLTRSLYPPPWSAGLERARLTGRFARDFNKHVRSNVQFLTARGWRDAAT